MGKRKASNKSAFGQPLAPLARPTSPGGPGSHAHARRWGTPLTTGNRGCNVGGSGLRRLRFGDGRLRNRAVPKLYRADGSVKG